MRRALGLSWRYNDSGAKRKRATARKLVGTPAPALAAPPAEVVPEQLSNAEALALFAAAQAVGHGKLAVFFNSVNAGQRQQVSDAPREVKRLYRRAAALYAKEIKFEPTLPFALPATRPPFTMPTPGSLAAIRRAGRRGGGEEIDLDQQGHHGLDSRHGGCSKRSAPPPLAG